MREAAEGSRNGAEDIFLFSGGLAAAGRVQGGAEVRVIL